MPKPIVAGIDPFEPDRSPLVLAAALARITGAPLIAVAGYVHDPITDTVSAGRVERDLREVAASALEDATAGVDAERVAAPGYSASHALHDIAAARGAGLIVVGSSRKGTFGRLAPGTTAERLLHGAACPVAVAPAELADDWTPTRVGVGYIALDEGRHALTAAAAFARLAGARLEAVTAVDPRWGQSAAVPAYGAEHDLDAARENAARALGRALAAAGRDAAEGTVFTGDPVDALVALSARSDLVVCGSRGYGPIQAVLLGGVSHGLLRGARCPVLVIPRGAGNAVAALTGADADAATVA